MLTIPAPTLPSATPSLAEPVIVTLAGIKASDGHDLTSDEVASVGVLVFRGAPGSAELWDDSAKQWVATPTDGELIARTPVPGVYKKGATPSWQATLVAIGQKDAANADIYSAAEGGTPTYFVRGIAKTQGSASDSGLSLPSASFTFVDGTSKSRFLTQFDTPKTKAEDATKVRLQLKGSALQSAGYLEIRTQSGFEVELANCDASGNVLAKVLLDASGAIRLTPAVGQRVIIAGDTEVERLLYAPSGGGVKQWLA